MVMPTKKDWTHSPSSGPRSIASSCVSRSVTILEKLMLVLPTITPDARLTTFWVKSNTPITMFHVLDTIKTAQADLNIHLKNIQVSTSLRLLRSVSICISSSVITMVRITPAMGRMTVLDKFCTILKIPPFHAWGVSPTWVVMSATFSFTLSNSPERLLRMPLINSSFSQSVMASIKKSMDDPLLPGQRNTAGHVD